MQFSALKANYLRFRDNKTLTKAIEQNEEVLLVYCLDENILRQQRLVKDVNFMAKFLLEASAVLDKNYGRLVSDSRFCLAIQVP